MWREQDDLLRSVAGAEEPLSLTLLADLPELGKLGRKRIAALVGWRWPAPHPFEGLWPVYCAGYCLLNIRSLPILAPEDLRKLVAALMTHHLSLADKLDTVPRETVPAAPVVGEIRVCPMARDSMQWRNHWPER